MDIIFKSVKEMTPREVRQAYRLTLPEGCMKETLQECRRGDLIGNVGLIYEGKRLVSWALAFKYPFEKRRHVYFYTNEKYRRRGYGSTLFRQMKNRYKTFGVSPWDTTSGRFFITQRIADTDYAMAKSAADNSGD